VVHPGARRTDSQQANHNLLLSADAVVDTKPELEIHNDDVKCSHGATVGRLDEDKVFYLRSRGIDAKSARDLLIRAFAHDVTDRISIEAVHARLDRWMAERLPALGGGAS
jgi:Fe-S cluster assembly protein SufD